MSLTHIATWPAVVALTVMCPDLVLRGIWVNVTQLWTRSSAISERPRCRER